MPEEAEAALIPLHASARGEGKEYTGPSLIPGDGDHGTTGAPMSALRPPRAGARILHRHFWDFLLKTEFLRWAQNKRSTRLKALCKSPRSGQGQHCATREVNSRMLTALSTALFPPRPTKRMEMFQLGEPRVEMVGEEQNPSLLKSTELRICEKMCSLHSAGGERCKEGGKKKRERDNEKVLFLIPISQVQRMEPKQIF